MTNSQLFSIIVTVKLYFRTVEGGTKEGVGGMLGVIDKNIISPYGESITPRSLSCLPCMQAFILQHLLL